MLGVPARVLQHPSGEVDVLGPAVMDLDELVLGRGVRYEYFADLHVLVDIFPPPRRAPWRTTTKGGRLRHGGDPSRLEPDDRFRHTQTEVMISSPPFDTK